MQENIQIKDHNLRFSWGFDRWDVNAPELVDFDWRMQSAIHHAEDPDGRIWWWSTEDNVWFALHEDAERIARLDHAFLVGELLRAVPVVRLFVRATSDGEREAARLALKRLGRAASDWSQVQLPTTLSTEERKRWSSFRTTFDAASTVYEMVTRSLRSKLAALTTNDIPEFSREIYDALRKADF